MRLNSIGRTVEVGCFFTKENYSDVHVCAEDGIGNSEFNVVNC